MTRHPMPAARVSATCPTPIVSGRCQISLLSAAVALALGIVSIDASALALGRLNVQSALGEPLRAEIEVAEAKADEIHDLKVRMASIGSLPRCRRALQRGLVRYSGQSAAPRRRPLCREADQQPAAQRTLSRSARRGQLEFGPNRPRLHGVARSAEEPQRAAARRSRPLHRKSRRLRLPSAPLPSAVQPPISRPAPGCRRPTAPADSGTCSRRRPGSGDQQVTVQPGDTAGKIAGAYKSADVSLDQMLVAMLRANPSAFIDGNVNRIKAGAVLDMPAASQAGAVPAAEARRTVVAQSRDFNEYRRRLAENAPASRVPDADRQASGKLQANVEDRNAANASADKLKITQGGSSRRRSRRRARESPAGAGQQCPRRRAVEEHQRAEQAASRKRRAGTAGGSPPAPAPPCASTPLDSAQVPAAAPSSSDLPPLRRPLRRQSGPTLPGVGAPAGTARRRCRSAAAGCHACRSPRPPVAAPAPAPRRRVQARQRPSRRSAAFLPN